MGLTLKMTSAAILGASSKYSRSQKVGNPKASFLKSNVKGIPALFGLTPVSNFMGFTVNSQSMVLDFVHGHELEKRSPAAHQVMLTATDFCH